MHACEEEAPNQGTPIDICDPEVCAFHPNAFPYYLHQHFIRTPF